MKNYRVRAGKSYACPICGKIFSVSHMGNAIDFSTLCECVETASMDGWIRFKGEVKFPELEDLEWTNPLLVPKDPSWRIEKGFYIGS